MVGKHIVRGLTLAGLILSVVLVGCFKSTPVAAVPATPEEAAQIRQLLDGTSWYVHTYHEENGGEKDAAELFVFLSSGGTEGPIVVTSQYREATGNFSYSDARTMLYSMTIDGKNVMLRLPSLRSNPTAARSLRINRWSPDATSMEMFDYDFTRTYTLRRVLPGRAPSTLVGSYAWMRMAPTAEDKNVVRVESTADCELRVPSEGKAPSFGAIPMARSRASGLRVTR